MEDRNKTSEDEDPIEATIGSFGYYQLCVYIVIAISLLCMNYQVVNIALLLPSIDYECLDEIYENATTNVNICPCNNPEFNRTVFEETIVTKWNLICDHTWISSLSQGIVQTGVFFGSVIFGYISDRFGRKLAFSSSVFSGAVFVAMTGLTPDVWSFLIFRFLTGISYGGIFTSAYIHQIELVGKSIRTRITMMLELSYILAYISIAGIGYMIRDFQKLQLAVSVPWLVTFGLFWILPESPRWLLMKGRTNDAVQLLRKIAKRNKRPIDQIEDVINRFQKITPNDNEDMPLMKIFVWNGEIRKFAFLTWTLWICISYAFYGLSQYLGRLSGNIFLNILITSLINIPSFILLVLLFENLRRRLSITIILAICAINTFTIMLIPNNGAVRLILTSIGINGLHGLFLFLYLYTSEIFPTVIRCSALGMASMFGRIGGWSAPFVIDTDDEYVILGSYTVVVVVSAFLMIWLPETKYKVLSNSVKVNNALSISNGKSEVKRNFEYENSANTC